MKPPLISCICPTYGRIPYDTFMLEECVYWFTQQTYPNKELIILNDAASQKLVCHVRDVFVINIPLRCRTLGEKYNKLTTIAQGDIIVPWEDDDISLPNRLVQIANHLRGEYEYWKPGGAFFQNGPNAPITFCAKSNVFHNASGYKRSLLNKVKYPEVSGPQDALFDQKALQVARFNSIRLAVPAEYQYVYRWQHGSGKQPNLSGHGDPEQAYQSRPVPEEGTFTIRPVMHRNYMEDCNAAARAN